MIYHKLASSGKLYRFSVSESSQQAMRVAIHTHQKARIAFVQSWPLLVYSLVGTFPKPFETGGAGAAVLRPYGLSFPVFLKMNRNTGFKIRIAVPFRPVFALISSTILSAL